MKDKRNIEIFLFLLDKLNFKKTDLIASSNFYLFVGKLYVNSKILARFHIQKALTKKVIYFQFCWSRILI